MRRVVKVGGSLLVRNDLPDSLRQWIAGQPAAQTFVIVGGGELIDAIRDLDQVRPCDPALIHWLCVDLLQSTFRLAASWFASWPSIDSTQDLDRTAASHSGVGETFLVSVRSFYHPHSGSDLPINWDTTTDSIAAELALRVNADELVLLKSCEVDSDADVVQLVRSGIVDPAFARVAVKLPAFRVERLS
jgi:aspartokinase-like uncharacterized kinase